MPTPEQKKKLLKAKIAVALHDELGRVPIFGALAEFERDIIRERTNAGLLAARARGRKGGRPKSLTGKKVAMAQELYNNKQNSIADLTIRVRG